MQRLIIGCGYLGWRVARRWVAAGDRVAALTRSAETADKLRAEGVEPYLGDVLQADSLSQLPAVDTVLWAVGWDRSSGRSQQEVYCGGLENGLRQLAGRCSRFVYVSSSSVYGQSAGEWVDEDSPCHPLQPNGQVCLAAEPLVNGLNKKCGTARGIVLRLSGIYGPDRLLSRVETLRSGEPLSGNPDGWLNLIHVDDAAQAVMLAAEIPDPRPVYLVSDDEPLLRRDYYSLLAELVGAPSPQFADNAAQAGGSRTQGFNKRCRNTLARESLGWTLTYPTFRQGLPQAVGQCQSKKDSLHDL